MTAYGVLVVLGMGFVGVLLWRLLAPDLRGLPAGSTLREGVLVALGGYVGLGLLTHPLAVLAGLGEEPAFGPLVLVRALAGLLCVGLVVAVYAPRGLLGSIGLRRAGGPPAPVVAVAAWLACLPLVMAVSWLNVQLQESLSEEMVPQQWLAQFLESADAQASPLAWAAMVLVLPFCEEVFFRGGLYGGLRRVVSVPLAVTLSAVAFGLVHDPAYMLPTATLGGVLALLYERTGSLAAPVCFHALHNGLTLAIVSTHPELAA